MQKRVVVDQITIDVKNGGHRLYRFCKQIVDDDGTVLSEQYHRTAVEPDGDDMAQMAFVNEHLRDGLRAGEIAADDLVLVDSITKGIKKTLGPRATKWRADQEARAKK